MQRLITLTAIGLLLAGCDDIPATKPIPTDNKDVEVEKLFTVDGCAIYRFEDKGQHYFTNCQGSVSSYIRHGKVVTQEQISTGGIAHD